MGFFQDLFGDTAAKAAQTAASQKIAGINAGVTQQQPYFSKASQALDTGYGSASATLAPLYDTGVGGLGLYSDLTGVGGTAGQDRARQLFNTDPGYQFARDEALKATERTRGTGGYQNSGNVLTALEDRASGLAQQQYKDWASRIGQFLPYSLTAGQLASQNQQQQGVNTAGLNLNQGTYLSNQQGAIGNAQAAGTLGEAQARTQAAGNIANLGTKLLGFALAPVTGGTSLLGSLGGGNEFGVSDDELYGVGARALQA
jgi:hypothetical protein